MCGRGLNGDRQLSNQQKDWRRTELMGTRRDYGQRRLTTGLAFGGEHSEQGVEGQENDERDRGRETTQRITKFWQQQLQCKAPWESWCLWIICPGRLINTSLVTIPPKCPLKPGTFSPPRDNDRVSGCWVGRLTQGDLVQRDHPSRVVLDAMLRPCRLRILNYGLSRGPKVAYLPCSGSLDVSRRNESVRTPYQAWPRRWPRSRSQHVDPDAWSGCCGEQAFSKYSAQKEEHVSGPCASDAICSTSMEHLTRPLKPRLYLNERKGVHLRQKHQDEERAA